jgi:ParB-like chromosome segregation protein Spo0J
LRREKLPPYKSVLVSELLPYAKNARTHSPAQVSQLAASIEEFGFISPVIIDGEKGIVAGHGRVLAAKKLGRKEVPCIEVDWLSDEQRRAFILADNKLALNAGWDEALLKEELEALSSLEIDLSLTGFSDLEIQSLTFDGNFEPTSEDDQGKLDEVKKSTCPSCGHEF